MQEFLESSGGLGELLGVLERPWKKLRERSRVFCEVARAILHCFFWRTHLMVCLFFLLSLLRKSWSIFTRVGEH